MERIERIREEEAKEAHFKSLVSQGQPCRHPLLIVDMVLSCQLITILFPSFSPFVDHSFIDLLY